MNLSTLSSSVHLSVLIPCLLAAAAAAGVGTAGSAPGADRDLRITVYNSNLALVRDVRTLDVPKGQGTIEVSDIPAQLDPTSVHFKAQSGEVNVLEQNFQYDLAGADRILQRYLDAPVEAVLKDGALKSGTLLSYDGGALVLKGEDGSVNLVSRDAAVDLRFPKLPEGLRTKPTLVWLLQSPQGGPLPIELSYLTAGVSWHAEYVAVTNEEDTSMDLSAWVSLENNSGASYPEADLQLVAGDVARVQPERGPMPASPMMMAKTARDGGSQGFEEETFFEYHLYTLDRKTTIADKETKQVALFPPATAPIRKIYEYNGQRDDKKVRVILEAENRKDLGLGMPLPAGTVRVYKKDSHASLQFVGEDHIDHTPKNEKIRLGVGKAFDVVGERKDLSVNRISDRVSERSVEVRLRNRKTEKIQVVVQESCYGDWSITTSSIPGIKKDASTAEFRVDVAPDSESVLTFTIRQE